jgi:hypothetical protein
MTKTHNTMRKCILLTNSRIPSHSYITQPKTKYKKFTLKYSKQNIVGNRTGKKNNTSEISNKISRCLLVLKNGTIKNIRDKPIRNQRKYPATGK